MLCGSLQVGISFLNQFTGMTNETSAKRMCLEQTLKNLETDVKNAFTSKNWKDKTEDSKSRGYLEKVCAGFEDFNQSVEKYQGQPELAVEKIVGAASKCIGTKPPWRLRGSFVTIKLKKTDQVPTGQGDTMLKIENDCTVASLIKKIGKIMKEGKFTMQVFKCYLTTTLLTNCENNNNDIEYGADN